MIEPDWTGLYILAGEAGGFPYYRRDGLTKTLWKPGEGYAWRISEDVGLEDGPEWIQDPPAEGPEGLYPADHDATGTADVTPA